jgi:Putative amidoligase enzyme
LDPFYTTLEIKRIAQAIIHFEPAFEALVPPVRRENLYAKSNWLDSPTLAREDKSRSQLITDIEEAVDAEAVIRLIQMPDRHYAWNLWALSSKETIEFRKPPASSTPEEVLSWAELAMSFIQASVKYKSTEILQKVPATVGGLRWFILQFTVPEVNEAARMQRIWAGKDSNAALEPMSCTCGHWPWEAEKRKKEAPRLQRLAMADRERIRNLARTAREPYW